MKKAVVKTCIAIILVLSFILSATSCAVTGFTSQLNETSSIENNDTTTNHIPSKDLNTGCSASLKYENNHNYPNTDLEATEKEEHLQQRLEENNTASPPEEKPVDKEALTEKISDAELAELMLWIEGFEKQDVFSLAVDCVAFDLHNAGYEVFQALAIIGDNIIPGLAFTGYEVYDESDGQTIYNCGFIQLTESGVEENLILTRDDVDQSVAVIPYGECDTSISFIVSMGFSLSSYSGIYNDFFFRYDQLTEYTVNITIEENDRSIWDESIDLFNFTENRFVFKGNMSYNHISASPYFSDEAKAFAAAYETVEKIIAYQDSNAYNAERDVLIVYSSDVLNEFLLNNQEGKINGFLLEKINEIEVDPNQFVLVTAEGVQIETIVDTEALAQERFFNGLITVLANIILVAGSIAVAVASCGTGTPLAVTAICVAASTGAALYATSNIISGCTDIVYSANGNISNESINPLLECFKAAIPDDELATKVYHIFGISSSLIPSILLPASAAVSLSHAAKAAGATVTIWNTTLAVVRAVGVEAVKMGVTAAVSAGVGYGTKAIVTEVTGNVNIGNLFGFISSSIAGVFTYKGLQKFDAKYNFSGLHSKAVLNSKNQKNLIEELKQRNVKFTEDDIIFIEKDSSGKIIWLEKGNPDAGLEHILRGNGKKPGHASDFFKAFGISEDQIPTFLRGVILAGNYTTQGGVRIYSVPNSKHSLWVVMGDNGFIVTAYPH